MALVGLLLVIISIVLPVSARGASDSTLLAALEQMYAPELDSASTIQVLGAAITRSDMQIHLDSGTITFFQPLILDSTKLYYGGLFVGSGRLRVQPPLAMERQQLQRFVKSDSLYRSFTKLVIMFDTATYRRLTRLPESKPATMPLASAKYLEVIQKDLQDSKDRWWFFNALGYLAAPPEEQYLLFTGPVDGAGNLLYLYDPNAEEEVGLFKREMRVLYDIIFQTVCSYPANSHDSMLGLSPDAVTPIRARHYDIKATIRKSGELEAVTRFEGDVVQAAQILDFHLDREMEIDSVLDGKGDKVSFRRYKDSDYWFGLWLVLDKPLTPGDEATFTFYYSGDVAEMELGQYYVFAGADWYPRVGHWQRATYDIRLKSPGDYTLIATGELQDSVRTRDSLVTNWRIRPATSNASFNIGLFKRYRFDGDGLTPANIYFSQDLHRSIGSSLGAAMVATGRHMERQVAEDIQQSMRLYDSLFGSYPHKQIDASEILQISSEAFPAFLHMSFFTWIHTDDWGYNRLHRAHETAHQWWGAGVGFSSYRDQWLSEGFAEYSAFMYLQKVAGEKQFLDRLKEHVASVLDERKDAGAVGLGPRAVNVKDRKNYYVVIYHKGALVLHMLRYLLMDLNSRNEDRFLGLMREFYETYNGKDASTADFHRLAEKHAGQDLDWFFRQWIYTSDIPTYKCKSSIKEGDTSYIATLQVSQSKVPGEFRMSLPVEFEYYDGQKEYRRLWVDKPSETYELHLPKRPKRVRFNPFYSVLAEVKQ